MQKISQVFLSYSSADLEAVRRLYRELRLRNVNVWFDKEHLSVGPWLPQIERAIYRSQAAIFCLSERAISNLEDETGVQQHEITVAYEIARKLPSNQFAIIPVRLEDCGRGDHRLSTAQQFDLFEDWTPAIDRLAAAIGGVSEQDGLRYRATTQLLKGDYINAYASLVAAGVIAEDSPDSLYLKGVCLFNLKQFRNAAEIFQESDSRFGKNQKTAYAIAQSLLNAGEIRRCRELVDEAVATWPEDTLLRSVERRLRLADPPPATYDVVLDDWDCAVSFSFEGYEGTLVAPGVGDRVKAGEPIAWSVIYAGWEGYSYVEIEATVSGYIIDRPHRDGEIPVGSVPICRIAGEAGQVPLAYPISLYR